jgi:AraC-like DNA-binding protein
MSRRKAEAAQTPAPAGWPEAVQRPARFLYGERSSLDPRASRPDYIASANLFRRSYVRTIGESEGQPLDSTTAWFIGNNLAFYKLTSNSCVEAKRTVEDCRRDGLDGVAFDYVLSGHYEETTEAGRIRLDAGDLGLVQTTIEVTARSRLVRMASIFLPRPRLVEALGSDLSDPAFRLLHLTSAPLAPFAGAQMRLLFDLYKTLAPSDFEIALDSAAALLLQVLRGELLRLSRPEEQVDARFERAIAYIEQHGRRPDLDPEDIGRAIGMSRAGLYRLFRQQGLMVAGYLRDVRLRWFIEALRAPDDASIAQIAWNSGFEMQAADFARLFKRAYGMTPRDARTALRAGQQVPRAP